MLFHAGITARLLWQDACPSVCTRWYCVIVIQWNVNRK